MAKENRYIDLLNKIEQLEESNICQNNNERLIIDQLNNVIEADKLEKMFKSVINNSDLAFLNSDLSEILKQYKRYVENVENTEIIDLKEYNKIKRKIKYLEKLKSEIDVYYNSLVSKFENEINEKLDTCTSSIMKQSITFPDLLARLDPSSYSLYSIMKDKKIMADLEFGVIYDKAVKEKQKIIDICNQVLESKTTALENIDMIIERNKINDEIKHIERKKQLIEDAQLEEKLKVVNDNLEDLRRRGFKKSNDHRKVKENQKEKNRILKLIQTYNNIRDEYDLKLKEFTFTNKRLISKGLGKLLFGINTNLKLVLKDDKTLNTSLEEIRNKEDLERFYNEIEIISIKNQLDLKEKFECLEEEFINQASDEAKLILNKYPHKANHLVELNRSDKTNDIRPYLRLFTIESLLIIRNTPISDMDIDKRKYNRIKRAYNSELNRQYDYYFDKYADILNDQYENTSDKVLKK